MLHTRRALLQKAPPIGLDLVLYTSVYNSGALAYIYYKEILLTVSLPAARCGHQRSSRQRRRRQENKPPAAPWAKSCVCAPVSECTLGYGIFCIYMHSLGRNEQQNQHSRRLGVWKMHMWLHERNRSMNGLMQPPLSANELRSCSLTLSLIVSCIECNSPRNVTHG